jgi:hypothetical protein
MDQVSYDLKELQRLEAEATRVPALDWSPAETSQWEYARDLFIAAAAGMLERMAKLEDVAEAARGFYGPGTGSSGAIIDALDALDALTTAEPR